LLMWKKRILSFLLVISMLAGLCPTTVLATGEKNNVNVHFEGHKPVYLEAEGENVLKIARTEQMSKAYTVTVQVYDNSANYEEDYRIEYDGKAISKLEGATSIYDAFRDNGELSSNLPVDAAEQIVTYEESTETAGTASDSEMLKQLRELNVLAAEFDESKAINSHLECDFEIFSRSFCLQGMDLLKSDFLKVVELFLEGTNLSQETANALLSYLCLKIAGNTKAKENSLCHKVCSFIRANYKAPLTVASIAKEFNYHPNYLGATFGKITGSSVLTYLNEVRLSASKELLLKGNSVADTAFMVGFKNADHFSKRFTEKYGLSPTRFKKENLWV